MTEEEARKKWCPFARVADHDGDNATGGYSYNRNVGGHPTDEACCIGSACMAWKFKDDEATHSLNDVRHFLTDQKFIGDAILERKPHGYCSLAGKS